jgi:hypothetical protein
MLTKDSPTRQFAVLPAELLKKLKWVAVDSVVGKEVEAITKAHAKCTTQLVAIADNHAKFLSNLGWTRVASRLSQSIATIATNQ